ncbi:hypothetical protein DPMN_128175 [Dreissena polymorpha]|uniref:Uncharacterized protein n=1 Tax=Dreissena polymorpha TaxID=45954 RepID=A0A9D4JZW1_DREPO|nr:hypothetical protein DPMN_128175 [Dreissena polymorpha]
MATGKQMHGMWTAKSQRRRLLQKSIGRRRLLVLPWALQELPRTETSHGSNDVSNIGQFKQTIA